METFNYKPLILLLLINLPCFEFQVTIAKNTQVTPRCGSQLISIEINFDPTQLPGGKFHDWIVVGVSGRPECRLRGNGETKYIIEIAVFNDPCLTQIPARNVFQNRIRIGKNPVVILEGDQSITVKCVYGLPTVETIALPVVNPNFNIEKTAQGIEEFGSHDNKASKPRTSTATIFDKRTMRGTESRVVPVPVVSLNKAPTETPTSTRQSALNRLSAKKKNAAPLAPKKNLPLKSNLEEFVSKTYAMGEYNDIASPAYAYTSEVYEEREVDVGFGTDRSKRSVIDDKSLNDDGAVSSYRSITEIVHAAETANLSQIPSVPSESHHHHNELETLLMDAVAPIRGFGYRKLTEQEMSRWKNLIQKDAHLRELLSSSKSVAEIEDIFESNEYKNLFSSTKWHEIAQCVHRSLTQSLDRSNSQSQLQLFVGNVHSDW
ncbi:unnamed protein product [Caenorhabditis bovis]|uniref:ZP domain-containing protein n=1 Tax=Caenorhabditis bovis TaxID=2654633 RepID=A0A8S1EEN0_9PELO|nr:unnamed protein product [Caenorhabditis bovis]